jgi:site-specific recombinase XerD
MAVPKLKLHKATGRYCVRIDGREVYLGKDKAQAEQEYFLLMAGIRPTADGHKVYIAELIEQYLDYQKKYGRITDRMKYSMRDLNRSIGHYSTDQIHMAEVIRVREMMMMPSETGHRHCRKEINRMMCECARCFKWAAAHELAPAEIHAKFCVLEPLKAGRCDAPERKAVSVVGLDAVRAVQGNVRVPVKAMIELQLLTGARPGEIVNLQVDMIDRTVDPWKCELTAHKTAHRGHKRVLFFGERAQEVLRPFLLAAGGGYLFTTGTEGNPYDVTAYRKAITRGCVAAKVPHWHPHQLRHTAATELRKQYGVEVARAVLGHAHVAATEIYAEVDQQVASRIAAERG